MTPPANQMTWLQTLDTGSATLWRQHTPVVQRVGWVCTPCDGYSRRQISRIQRLIWAARAATTTTWFIQTQTSQARLIGQRTDDVIQAFMNLYCEQLGVLPLLLPCRQTLLFVCHLTVSWSLPLADSFPASRRFLLGGAQRTEMQRNHSKWRSEANTQTVWMWLKGFSFGSSAGVCRSWLTEGTFTCYCRNHKWRLRICFGEKEEITLLFLHLLKPDTYFIHGSGNETFSPVLFLAVTGSDSCSLLVHWKRI